MLTGPGAACLDKKLWCLWGFDAARQHGIACSAHRYDDSGPWWRSTYVYHLTDRPRNGTTIPNKIRIGNSRSPETEESGAGSLSFQLRGTSPGPESTTRALRKLTTDARAAKHFHPSPRFPTFFSLTQHPQPTLHLSLDKYPIFLLNANFWFPVVSVICSNEQAPCHPAVSRLNGESERKSAVTSNAYFFLCHLFYRITSSPHPRRRPPVYGPPEGRCGGALFVWWFIFFIFIFLLTL